MGRIQGQRNTQVYEFMRTSHRGNRALGHVWLDRVAAVGGHNIGGRRAWGARTAVEGNVEPSQKLGPFSLQKTQFFERETKDAAAQGHLPKQAKTPVRRQ